MWYTVFTKHFTVACENSFVVWNFHIFWNNVMHHHPAHGVVSDYVDLAFVFDCASQSFSVTLFIKPFTYSWWKTCIHVGRSISSCGFWIFWFYVLFSLYFTIFSIFVSTEPLTSRPRWRTCWRYNLPRIYVECWIFWCGLWLTWPCVLFLTVFRNRVYCLCLPNFAPLYGYNIVPWIVV